MLNLSPELRAHAPEFISALANLKFEKTDDGGIYFPAAKATAHGMYEHNVNGLDTRFDANLLTTEGLTSMLAIDLGATAKISAWYLALYSGAIDPVATWTAANFTANATEITSLTEGYSESVRQTFTASTAAAASINNTAAKAAFTIVTASTLTVWGVGLLSSSVRGGTTGVLKSATRFASVRTLNTADVFNIGYTISLTSS